MQNLMNESNLKFYIKSPQVFTSQIASFSLSKSGISNNMLWFYRLSDNPSIVQVHAEAIPSIRWNGYLIPLYKVDADQNWEPVWEFFGDNCLDIQALVPGAIINSPFRGVILDITDDQEKVDVLNLDTKGIYTLDSTVNGHIYLQK